MARLDVIEAAIAYLLVALLLSSTAHPWYLLWVLALTPLPIAGILSDAPLPAVAAQMRRFASAIAGLGVQHPHLLMRLSTYTLPVSSGLRITDMGYVRARERALRCALAW